MSKREENHCKPPLPGAMQGVQLKVRVVERMLVQEGRGTGLQVPPTLSFPPSPSAGSEEDPFFSTEHHQAAGKGASFETAAHQSMEGVTSATSEVMQCAEDNSTMVVDMGTRMAPAPVHHATPLTPGAVALQQGNSILKWRRPITLKEDLSDLQYREIQPEGFVKCGDFKDVCQMYKEQSDQMKKGVICNTEVLHSFNGEYKENKHYTVNPAKFKGGYGECSMCQDNTTGKTFIRKTVTEPWKNEVLVPMQLKGIPGIPEVYGIIQRGDTSEIFQKFAGDSLDKLRRPDSGYEDMVSSHLMVLGLAFQGFKTLDKLHSKGVQHLDIKPENLCVDMGGSQPSMYLIDFGSCQAPGEVTNEGVTYEYMSPENARTLIENKRRAHQVPLEAGGDVWAMALSMMYLLRGFHVMVKHLTGDTAYYGTPQEQSEQRLLSLLKITQLQDRDIAQLMDPTWPPVLRELFTNTLCVDKDRRWTAKKAANFAMKVIIGVKMAQSGASGVSARQTAASSGVQPLPPASSAVTQGSASPAGSPAAVAGVVRIRDPAVRIMVEEHPLCPWNVAGPGVTPAVGPTPQVVARTHIHPGKRKLDEDQVPAQVFKIIRK